MTACNDRVEAWPFWEGSAICLTVKPHEGEQYTLEITLDRAKNLAQSLQKAIQYYEETEEKVQEYFEKEKANRSSHKNSQDSQF